MSKDRVISLSDRLYSSRIVSTYIKFLRQEYGHVDLDDILVYSDMETYQVEDEAYWFTQEQIDLFHKRIAEVTGDPHISREVGRFAFSLDSMGFVKNYILGCMSIGNVFEIIAKLSPKFVKSCTWESARLAPNKAKIVVTPRPGAREEPYQCENRMGYFEAGVKLFHHKFPTVEETKCVHRGDDYCEFVVTWRDFRYEKWKKVRNFAAAILVAFGVATSLGSPQMGFVTASIGLAILFALSSVTWSLERKELRDGIHNLSVSTDEVVKKMETSIKNMDFARQVIVALSLEKNREDMVKQIALLFEAELDYDRGSVFLVNKDKTRLDFYGGFGYKEEDLPALRKMNPSLRADSTGVFTVCFRERRPFLVNDVDEIGPKLSPRSLEFATQMGSKSFICVPIVSSNETLGVLALDNLISKRPLLQSDLNLITRIAPEIGMAIQNATASEDKQRQFHSILQVLASSIDARDPLTAGHSDRVTQFAVGISREMGLSNELIEMIRVAALLHDYGKIAIADAILKKPGKLTNEEYDEIKTHAAKTKEILEKIEFQGIYREVPHVASSHHEKYDGTGYPKGIKGTDIPLGARILAVSDVFEALTAKRHYRGPMPLEEAFGLLERDKGKHFDPDVVEAFARFYEKEGKLLDAPYFEDLKKEEQEGPLPDEQPFSASDKVVQIRHKRRTTAASVNPART